MRSPFARGPLSEASRLRIAVVTPASILLSLHLPGGWGVRYEVNVTPKECFANKQEVGSQSENGANGRAIRKDFRRGVYLRVRYKNKCMNRKPHYTACRSKDIRVTALCVRGRGELFSLLKRFTPA